MRASITFAIDKSLYLRNPEETSLGKKIVAESILMLDEQGFESFTFKKLATKIGSTEASIYRYFSNKHQLLCYLVSWYWSWLDYLIEFHTTNIPDPRERLETAIGALVEAGTDDPNIPHIDESVLHRVVISESARIYMTRPSGKTDYSSVLAGYNELCSHLSELIKAVDPKYRHAHELITALLSTAHSQIFLMYKSQDHKVKRKDQKDIKVFLNHLVFTSLHH